MRVLTVRIMTTDDAFQATSKNATRAMTGYLIGSELVFSSVELLYRTMLVPNRWRIIKAMVGAPAVSIRGLSRTVNRTYHGVHSDVQALLSGGVLDKEGNKIVLPYDRIRIEFNSDDAAA